MFFISLEIQLLCNLLYSFLFQEKYFIISFPCFYSGTLRVKYKKKFMNHFSFKVLSWYRKKKGADVYRGGVQ